MAAPATLTPRLESLRASLRARWFAAGALRLAAEVAAFLAVQFAVDRLLWLPVGARRVVAVIALLLFAARLFMLVVRPLRKAITARDLALAVERRHPALAGALASLVEVEAAARVPPDVSPELLEQWRAATAARAGQFRLDAIFEPRLLRRLAALDGAALVLLAGFAVLRGAEARIFLARLAGADLDWPRRTRLELDVAGASESVHFRVERDDDGVARRVIVARGASLPIVVRARGTIPEEVALIVREEGRPGTDEIRMVQREEAAGEFGYRFKNAMRAMELSAAGGDDPGHGLELVVDVVAPPAVERLVATITPPAYTGRPPVREERQEFAVPAGTRLDLEVATAGDVSEARLTLHADPGTARPLVRDERTPGLWRAEVVVEESGTLNLHLTGENGFKNLQPIDYPLAVIADRKPVVELARPAVSDLEVTARAAIPFRTLVDDDYGVVVVRLDLRRGDDSGSGAIALAGEGSARPGPLAGTGEPHVLDALLDLTVLEVPRGEAPARVGVGDSLLYAVAAADNREHPPGTPEPNVTTSPGRRIDVVSDGEKTRKLTDRQQRVKNAAANARTAQAERLEGVTALLEGSADGAIETREFTALEVEQARVCGNVRQVARDLSDVAGEYALNRLDPTPSAERVLAVLVDELGRSPAGPSFDFGPYAALSAAHSRGEFGELQQLGHVLAMVDLALRASETHAQRALERIRGARLSGRQADRLAQLEEARTAQREVVALLDLLLQKMEEFEDFQEILDLFGGLVEDQREINRRAHGPPARSGG